MPDSCHSVSVAGVVVDDRGRVLLVQRRDNGHWEAPGGVLRETEESASFRWVAADEAADLADEAFAIRVQAGFHDWKWASGWERRPLGCVLYSSAAARGGASLLRLGFVCD